MAAPDDYAAGMNAALDLYQLMRPRSRQTALGVSSIGHCSSEAKYVLSGVAPTDSPVARQALFGTAAHEMIAAARKYMYPHLLLERELSITLPSGVVVLGHADEIDPREPSVTDWKTKADEADMVALRRTGSSEQQRFQRHLYALGAIQAGLVPADGLIVRNVWIDRAGQSDQVYVEQEPFSMQVVHDADRWLESVRYAAEHGEDTPREKHYDWCRRFCGFFTHCRGGTENADLFITDPEMVQAAALLHEGRAKAKEGEALEKSAKRVLAPLQQSAQGDVASFVAGNHRVRWAWVNSGAAAGGYWKVLVDRVAEETASV